MKVNTMNPAAWRGGGGAERMLLLLLLLLAPVACDVFDRALDVEAPSRIPASDLEDPARATLLVNGAISDFDCAFGAYVVATGVLADELEDATQTAARWAYDRRDIDANRDALYATSGCIGLGVYTPLSVARWSAENVLTKLEGSIDAQMPAGVHRLSLLATAAAYAGYSHLLLGEAFCTGVLLDANLQPGGEVPREELFRRAEARFTRAIEAAQASANAEILNMARVGLARVRLNLGNTAGALEAARSVDANFDARVMTASGVSSRRENRVWAQSNPQSSFNVSVAPQFQGLTVGGQADPRVPAQQTSQTSPTGIRVWAQTKYATAGSPIPIASRDEALLVIAEIEGGQTAVDIINQFRATAGLPSFTSSDPVEIQQQVIEERRRELFLEGHRFYDLVRLNLPLVPAPGTPYRNGGVYGNTTCLPLPAIERLNNPNFGA
ncbi:hypothetical protein BH23GEM7_BH23GEM7_07760 [soil metagenome]